MANKYYILIFVFILGCSEHQPSKSKVQSNNISLKTKTHETNKVEFIPDSSYIEYWCSSDILKKTAESLDKLELSIVSEFLATFHKDCRINVEYSEWSNELLFEVAKRKPYYLIQLLFENNSLDKELIIAEFESPIHDLIDLELIIYQIDKLDTRTEIKSEIIDALMMAKSKY